MMMDKLKNWRIILIGLLCSFTLCIEADSLLKRSDVRATMEELFSYHVEYKHLTPQLVKRSFKLYIDHFDPERVYLLQSEVRPFLELSEERLQAIIDKYDEDDLSIYQALNEVIVRAIKRVEQVRSKLKKGEEVGDLVEDYPSFATNQAELAQRTRGQFFKFLAREQGQREVNPEQWQRLFALWEKRQQRLEGAYLSKREQGEHLLALHTLKALAKSLDPHTSYFSPQEAFELRMLLEKQFEGIGVVLKESIDGIIISDFIKGGPAAQSGRILVGDLLISIDRQSLEGSSYEEILDKMKGKKGERIILGLKRMEGDGKITVLEVELTREKILIKEERVQSTLFPCSNGFIGVIQLPSFYESADESSCENDIREEIRELKKRGNLLGMVIDMRENGGGFLTQAIKVAGLFITSGVVAISKYAEGETKYLRDLDGRTYYTGPLVILTSKASASAAEIVAQALQDYGIALIVGDERTYGKGSIQYQTVTDKDAKFFFKVTVGKYYTVSGRSTQIEGVSGDILVPTPYSAFHIGERFLMYPLASDRISPAYVDPLIDINRQNRPWFQKNYLPYLHKRESYWRKMLPILSENSQARLKKSKNFSLFLKSLEQPGALSRGENWGLEDLQMEEALHIVQDMIFLQAEHPLTSLN
jgi:carboxyl-terminal processing protease